MDSLQALHRFWSQFLTAYDENTVPDNAMAVNNGRYITYAAGTAYFDEPIALSASLWYKSASWADITKKAAQIGKTIGIKGAIIPCDEGYVWIKRGVPFSQRMADKDEKIRRIYLNVEVEFITRF